MIGAVFALVGLINFINLVMTNIVTRRHEFATMQSIGMTNRQAPKNDDFGKLLLCAAGRDCRYTGCGDTWHDIAKSICRKWSYQYDDDIPDNLAACADYAGSLSGTGVYRSGCCTPTP